jgi:hypothetical protein
MSYGAAGVPGLTPWAKIQRPCRGSGIAGQARRLNGEERLRAYTRPYPKGLPEGERNMSADERRGEDARRPAARLHPHPNPLPERERGT